MPIRILFLVTCLALSLHAEDSIDAALALAKANHMEQARAALEKITATSPSDARAWHELGLVLRESNDIPSFERAAACLKKASDLAPENAHYLADFGGTSMELAGRTRSFSAATTGRAAMEKAIELDPENLDAREGLFQFYNQAPFIVGGSSRKASEQLEEIRKRDPDRATVLEVITKTAAKDYAAAFALCETVLTQHPTNYTALYQYGRTASLSGENLPRGLACLQKALTLEPPNRAAPRHTHIWYRIGDIHLKLGQATEAKQAFVESLKLDPLNRLAQAALDKLK